jgi:hypothetical protein
MYWVNAKSYGSELPCVFKVNVMNAQVYQERYSEEILSAQELEDFRGECERKIVI